MDPSQPARLGRQASPAEPAKSVQVAEQDVAPAPNLASDNHEAPITAEAGCDSLTRPATLSSQPAGNLPNGPTNATDPVSNESLKKSTYRQRKKIRRLLVRAHRSAGPLLRGPAMDQARDDIAAEFSKTLISERDLRDASRKNTYRSLLAPEKPENSLFRSSKAAAILDRARIKQSPCPPDQSTPFKSDLNRGTKPFNFNSPFKTGHQVPGPVGTQSVPQRPNLEEAGPYLATIELLPKHEATRVAKNAYEFEPSDTQPKPFILWTDGSASYTKNAPMAAAVAYHRPTPGLYPEWVVRAFGIEAYPRDIRSAESIGVEMGLEIALREWDALNWDYRASTAAGNDADYEEKWDDQELSQEAQPVVADFIQENHHEPNRDQELSSDLKDEHGNVLTDTEWPDYIGINEESHGLDDDVDWDDISEPTLEVSETPQPFKEVHLYTDSQDVLCCLDSLGNITMSSLQQEIFCRILSLMQQLAARGVTMRFRWVPGHAGITGNEHADKACGMARKLIKSAYEGCPKVWEIDVDINDPLMKQTMLRGGATWRSLQKNARRKVQTGRAQPKKKKEKGKKKVTPGLGQDRGLLKKENNIRKLKKKARRQLAVTAGSSADMPIVID